MRITVLEEDSEWFRDISRRAKQIASQDALIRTIFNLDLQQ